MQNDSQGVGRPASPVSPAPQNNPSDEPKVAEPGATPVELGGPSGPEPTRYGDWEKNGRCIDF